MKNGKEYIESLPESVFRNPKLEDVENAFNEGLRASQFPSQGLRWVKASERLPELYTDVHTKYNDNKYTGQFRKYNGITYFNADYDDEGVPTFLENHFQNLFWLDESAPSQGLREEEMTQEEWNDVAEVPNPDLASVASHSSTVGNSIEQGWKSVTELKDPKGVILVYFPKTGKVFAYDCSHTNGIANVIEQNKSALYKQIILP